MEDEAGGTKLEDGEEEFRSCCGDDDDHDDEIWKMTEDEVSVKMYFKGLSITEEIGYSGIGVVMERRKGEVAIVDQVQKKLDFYVDSTVADYLALMEGLVEAVKNGISHVYAYTDSSLLYNQMTLEEKLEIPFILALRERIIELAGDLETFQLKLVPSCYLERSSRLAGTAVGIVTFPASGDKSLENCSICCEDKMSAMMITMKCSHKFCSHCMRTYVEDKMQSCQVPIRCPQPGCRYYISLSVGRSFLTCDSYEPFVKAQEEAHALLSGRICCPHANCSVLLDSTHECLSARESSSSQSDNNWCFQEFCYSCGSEYRDGEQTCQCALWEEDTNTDNSIARSVQVSEQWAWETFNTMPMLTDAYSDQERSQLALIQRFLSGGFSLSDQEKTVKVDCYFQEAEEVKMKMSVEDAYRRSIQTLMKWIHRKVNMNKTQVFFRTYAPVHFRGGDWRTNGTCHLENLPDLTSTADSSDYRFQVLLDVLSELRSNQSHTDTMNVLNITHLAAKRKDGHASVYYLGPGVSPASIHRQDCSHWCLPGVPDSWNELLYALLLKRQQMSVRVSPFSQAPS